MKKRAFWDKAQWGEGNFFLAAIFGYVRGQERPLSFLLMAGVWDGVASKGEQEDGEGSGGEGE